MRRILLHWQSSLPVLLIYDKHIHDFPSTIKMPHFCTEKIGHEILPQNDWGNQQYFRSEWAIFSRALWADANFIAKKVKRHRKLMAFKWNENQQFQMIFFFFSGRGIYFGGRKFHVNFAASVLVPLWRFRDSWNAFPRRRRESNWGATFGQQRVWLRSLGAWHLQSL